MVTNPQLPDHWVGQSELENLIPTAYNWRTFRRVEIAQRYAICIVAGIVYDTKRRTFLEPNIDMRNGRRRFRLNCDDKAAGKRDATKVLYASRLILAAVHGSRGQNFQAHHIDGDRTNDTWRNLSWVTGKTNKRLASRSGENNPKAKLNGASLSRLIREYDEHVLMFGSPRLPFLAQKYKLTKDHITRLAQGKVRGKEVAAIREEQERERKELERARFKARHTMWMDVNHPFFPG